MNSGGTRAGQAASSRRVKQELVRLLFGAKYSKTGPEGHKKLDSASYSYADLKRAYFAKLQEIHPDKNKGSALFGSNSSKQQFHELQKTWEQYSDMAKSMEKVQSQGQGDFTKFGVGCSFSDNEYEKALRTEITDQACRGWFSAGELSARTESSKNSDFRYKPSSLIDDDMFVEVDNDTEEREDLTMANMQPNEKIASAKTLIPGYRG